MAIGETIVALGRVMASSLKGTLNAVLGNLQTLEGDGDVAPETSQEEPLYGQLGVYARPKAPVEDGAGSGNDPDGSTEFVGVRVGDRVYPVSYRDLRLLAKVNPDEGEVGLVQYGGGFVSLKDNADGDGSSIVIYAPRNDGDGNATAAHAISVDSAAGQSNIAIVHEGGASITMNVDGGIVLCSPNGQAYVEVSNDGVTINGAKVALCGGVNAGDSNPAVTQFLLTGAPVTLAWIAEVNAQLLAIKTLLEATGLPVASNVATAASGGAGNVPTSVPLVTTLTKGI